MKKVKIRIQNLMGVHARSAALLVKSASKYHSKIEIEYKSERINAKSILGIMALGIRKGEEIVVYTEGKDEEAALADVINLINDKFYEE